MDHSVMNSSLSCMELEIPRSPQSFQHFLESQKKLFHSQIDQLQKIVLTQCRLTGFNPLSQEMAAGALSIKIGKRSRDSLNPTAVKYMQSILSIKDTIGKKESREISALCGVTVTQVREFFAGQRSRIRKVIRSAHEKTVKLNTYMPSDVVSADAKPGLAACNEATLNDVDIECKDVEPSYSLLEVSIPRLDTSVKNFVENMLSLMRKVNTFSGQVKLMEWVLKVHNSAALYWFLTKGGMIILETWLNQATQEEQTTVVLVILKVLGHLPLHKALPVHMSAIVQTVNRLRFYRTSDVSNKARALLSRWSKMFVKIHSVEKLSYPTDSTQDVQRGMMRVSKILGDGCVHTKVNVLDKTSRLTCDSAGISRELEHIKPSKQLSGTPSDSSKKCAGGATYNSRERRKVLLVEQHMRTADRGIQVTKFSQPTQSRPISVDDIQKAKMRAVFMQNKHGKPDVPSKENSPHQMEKPHQTLPSEGRPASFSPDRSIALQVPKAFEEEKDGSLDSGTVAATCSSESKPSLSAMRPGLPAVLAEEVRGLKLKSCLKKAGASSWSDGEPASLSPPSTLSSDLVLTSVSQKLCTAKIQMQSVGPLLWQTPPEMIIDPLWIVGAGEDSKEAVLQAERIRQRDETFYKKIEDIPLNPLAPWDAPVDYDDTLTPEIPTKQIPDDVDSSEILAHCSMKIDAATETIIKNGQNPEPDLELLAVLLSNPDLVFALTADPGKKLTDTDLIGLLEMLKDRNSGLSVAAKNLTECLKDIQKNIASQLKREQSPLHEASIIQPLVRGSQIASKDTVTTRKLNLKVISTTDPEARHSHANDSLPERQVRPRVVPFQDPSGLQGKPQCNPSSRPHMQLAKDPSHKLLASQWVALAGIENGSCFGLTRNQSASCSYSSKTQVQLGGQTSLLNNKQLFPAPLVTRSRDSLGAKPFLLESRDHRPLYTSGPVMGKPGALDTQPPFPYHWKGKYTSGSQFESLNLHRKLNSNGLREHEMMANRSMLPRGWSSRHVQGKTRKWRDGCIRGS